MLFFTWLVFLCSSRQIILNKLRRLEIDHIRILTVVLETRMKERLMREDLFKCKLFPPHEPPSHTRSSPTVRIRIRCIVLKARGILELIIP